MYLEPQNGHHRCARQPLPTTRAAKLYEVTKQIVLTGHLVDSLFIAISNKRYNALAPAQQQKLAQAAQAAAAYNNDNRIRKKPNWLSSSKEGLQVTQPDVDAFRKAVQAAYQNSDYAKVWPKGLAERINATR